MFRTSGTPRPGSAGLAAYLHPGFDHIQGRVPEDAGGARRGPEHRRHDGMHLFPGVVALETQTMTKGRSGSTFVKRGFLTFVPVSQQVHHVESDRLIGPLFQHSGGQTLVGPPHT